MLFVVKQVGLTSISFRLALDNEAVPMQTETGAMPMLQTDNGTDNEQMPVQQAARTLGAQCSIVQNDNETTPMQTGFGSPSICGFLVSDD